MKRQNIFKKSQFYGMPAGKSASKWHMQVDSCESNMRFSSLCSVGAAWVECVGTKWTHWRKGKERRGKTNVLAGNLAQSASRNPAWTACELSVCRTEFLPQCPDRRSPPQWSAGRLSARWPPQTAPRRQRPAAGPTWDTASRSGPVEVHVGPVHPPTDLNEPEARRAKRAPTSVTWLCEEKKTRAKGSERPLLSAANRLRAWYMCALSWNTCFTAGHATNMLVSRWERLRPDRQSLERPCMFKSFTDEKHRN